MVREAVLIMESGLKVCKFLLHELSQRNYRQSRPMRLFDVLSPCSSMKENNANVAWRDDGEVG